MVKLYRYNTGDIKIWICRRDSCTLYIGIPLFSIGQQVSLSIGCRNFANRMSSQLLLIAFKST